MKDTKLIARYRGTVTKAVRATKEIDVPCADYHNPKVVHHYTKDEVIGVEPTYHHFTFGKRGDDIQGGIYVKVGKELPEFLELHVPAMTVDLKDLGLLLELKKGGYNGQR